MLLVAFKDILITSHIINILSFHGVVYPFGSNNIIIDIQYDTRSKYGYGTFNVEEKIMKKL
jgi:hypothetical protein